VAKAWKRLAAVIDGRHAEALGDALESLGALSVEVTDADAGTPEERAVFGEPGAEAEPWPRARVVALFEPEADARAAFDQALLESGATAIQPVLIDELADEDWVALTQRQFWPIRAGERLWVVPSWHQPPEPEAVNVLMDPGAAFGTGWHPTTRLCLAWLEHRVGGGDVVLDYGCGSGILGIAALKLGARAAIGVDVDPRALEAARYNATQNGVPLEVLEAGAEIAQPATITVANILANPLRVLAPLIASHTSSGGSIALSGILDEQVDEVVAAYAPYVRLEVVAGDSGWALLAGTRA
jgi:ribosomal protein L11 methyltransferase